MSEPKHIADVMAETVQAHGLVHESKIATIEFDGACEPKNPGGAATGGFRILIGNTVVCQKGEFFREGPGATNNFAEYCALGKALNVFAHNVQFSRSMGVEMLAIVGDSQLVVRQVNGDWACRKPHLEQLRDRCHELIREIEAAGIEVSISWIPREQNTAADRLSHRAYREYLIQKMTA